jgi:hypothetical protein
MVKDGRERSRFTAWVLLAVLTAVGVHWVFFSSPSEPESPEARIRGLLKRAEVAAEDRDLPTLGPLVSTSYTDPRGHDKQFIEGLLSYYFLHNRSIHLLTRVQPITFPEPSRAEVTVYIAMAGSRISGVEELARLRADLYRFDFKLADEGVGDWKVTEAEWRRAQREDFF